MLVDSPHAHLVPKDLGRNLAWRRRILEDAGRDMGFARALREMCAEDVHFYVNGFCWTYDPRDTVFPAKPFVTYPFQDTAIAEVCESVRDGYDLAWPKSRTMGASWMVLTAFEWFWHFKDDLSFLLISRNENYVDQSGNPKSLFWKIDFLHQNQPRWLLPSGRWMGWKDPGRKLLHLENADTRSVIDGESTTGDAGRGDRRTAMLIDEHAAFELNDGFKVLRSSRDTSRTRIFTSTPQGATNAFYEIVHNSGAKVTRLHWSEHPIYNRGLYSSEKDEGGVFRLNLYDENFQGVVKARRKDWQKNQSFIFPDEYPFILDGKLRSPWYDNEDARCVSAQEVAQELDIDFTGSDYQFFDPEFINILIQEYCLPPVLRGDLQYSPESLEPEGFVVDEKGPLWLWFNLAGNGGQLDDWSFFEGRTFGIGADISMGTGASNSVSSAVDLTTGRKVALLKTAHMEPSKFADYTIALAKWFNKAKMIWDASGATGRSFTKRVIERKYRSIYYRTSEGRVRERISDQPGYFLNPEDRAVLLRDYRQKLDERTFVNPSESGMKEALQFIVKPGGKVEHAKAANSQNPTGAREAHGDEVIADALASRLVATKIDERAARKPEVPWMSPAWRFEQEAKEMRDAKREDW